MGGENSAFRSLVPSLLSAQLARSYAAAAQSFVRNQGGGSSTSTNQSPANSPRPSDSEEEINVNDDDSDVEINSNSQAALPRLQQHHNSSSNPVVSPLQLTKHDRN
jgi:hypothetical protein